MRRDPMAMLPFIGYHVADYVQHWIDIGAQADQDKLPKIFYVNWFRRDGDGRFMWPGFGENSRVLKWIAQRVDGLVDARETPIGLLPTEDGLDVEGWTSRSPISGRWSDTGSRSGATRCRASAAGSTHSAGAFRASWSTSSCSWRRPSARNRAASAADTGRHVRRDGGLPEIPRGRAEPAPASRGSAAATA
nr:phosphoenolpyruvate carboxykinase domain-containing protein [Tessaracoccus coleopterorum]